MLRTFITASVVMLGAMTGNEVARAKAFAGLYTLPSPGGALTLSLLEAADGSVAGTLIGYDGTTYEVHGVVSLNQDEPASVEGTLTNPRGQGRFTLTIDEADDILVSIVPVDAFGNPDHASTMVYAAIRGGGPMPQPASPAAPSARKQADIDRQGGRDSRLVGVWAYQEIMSGGGMSVASQLVMQFRSDGVFLQGDARTIAGGAGFGLDSGSGDAVQQGIWRTQDDVLYAATAGSPWVPLARYELSGTSLLLVYYDGSRQLWHRQ